MLKFEMRDWILASVIAVLGFILTSNPFVHFLNGLSALTGALVLYLIMILIFVVLSKMDLIIFKLNFSSVSRFAGIFLITIAFFIITGWSSCYFNLAIGKQCDMSTIYTQSTDGAVFHIWSSIFPPNTKFGLILDRFLTYVFTPFLLTLVGGAMIKGKPNLNGI